MSSTDATLLVESMDGVVVATINRATRGNCLNRDVMRALSDLTARIRIDWSGPRNIRVLVITGAGEKTFSAGADITELADITPDGAYEQMRWGQQIFDGVEELPVPVIAAVNGYALGGGLELAMAADIRVAGSHARLGQPEINLANLPGWGGTQRLPRLVGVGRAKELILTGDPVDAPTALAFGLVNRVADDCLGEALKLARRLADKAPVALAGAKESIHIGVREGICAGLEAEARRVADCCATPAQRAATAAFLRR